jgi:hypothetical protein
VTVYRIVFEGPTSMAVSVATELADADGVDLISSESPSVVGRDTVKLVVSVEADQESVTDAVARIRGGMPTGARVEITDP